MGNTSRLYDTLVAVLCQQKNWLDVRHIKTLAGMMVGLIHTGKVSLTAWVPYVEGRAQLAQSTQRRLTRWLHNERVQVNRLYGPWLQAALVEWGEATLYLALDTSQLWGQYCLIRLSLIYRGRAVPLLWQVLEHGSSSVAFPDYQALLSEAAQLLPLGSRVVLLADRGFADTRLMRHLSDELGWHWRLRLKANLTVQRRGHASTKVGRISLQAGEARFWQQVTVTAQRYGPVHLALAQHRATQERWIVVSDEPTSLATFDEYGLRFEIEESFLDDKSNGFQLESSLLRSAQALQRLCFVLAVTTLYLVAQGTTVVEEGQRRWVDPHWFRGASYLRIGWDWVKHALVKGWSLLTTLHLSGEPDPEPAVASRTQFRNQPPISFTVSFETFG